MKTKEQNCTHKNNEYCPICDGYPKKDYCKSCEEVEKLSLQETEVINEDKLIKLNRRENQ